MIHQTGPLSLVFDVSDMGQRLVVVGPRAHFASTRSGALVSEPIALDLLPVGAA